MNWFGSFKMKPTWILLTLAILNNILLAAGVNETVTNSTVFAGPQDKKEKIRELYPTWKDFAVRFLPGPFYIDRYVTLVYFIVGFPGNLVSLVVWSTRRMYRGNSAAVYLAFMSANNIVVLLFALNRDLSRAWNLVFRLTPYSCEVKRVLISVSQYASPMFVLGFTVERWLAIYKPLSIDRICSTRRAIYICLGIILVTLTLCSGNAYLFTTDEYTCKERVETQAIMYAYSGALEVIFSGIVPLLALTFNCLVIREVARVNLANKRLSEIANQMDNHICSSGPDSRQQKTSSINNQHLSLGSLRGSVAMPRQRPRRSGNVSWTGTRWQGGSTASNTLCQADRSSGQQQGNRFRSTTLMLLVVSFYMIIVAVLGGIMYIIYYRGDLDYNASEEQVLTDPSWRTYIRLISIKTICDEIALSYYATSFFVFYATGASFRQHVHRMLTSLVRGLGWRCHSEGAATLPSLSKSRITSKRINRSRNPLISPEGPSASTRQLQSRRCQNAETIPGQAVGAVRLTTSMNSEEKHLNGSQNHILNKDKVEEPGNEEL